MSGSAIDIDPASEYPDTENNKASFLLMSIEEITAADFAEVFDEDPFKLPSGCAPCQPFSTYSQTWSCPSDERWNLLEHFSRLVEGTKPHLVTMEHVPPPEREDLFVDFVAVLECDPAGISRTRPRVSRATPQPTRRRPGRSDSCTGPAGD